MAVYAVEDESTQPYCPRLWEKANEVKPCYISLKNGEPIFLKMIIPRVL